MSDTKTQAPARGRKFIRLDTVFPIEFCFINKENNNAVSEWMQGFSNNFSKGGMCLEAHNVSAQTLFLLKAEGALLDMKITVPFSNKKTQTKAHVRWFQESATEKGAYTIGLQYEKADVAALVALMKYVYKKKIVFPFIFGIGIFLGLLTLLLGYHGMQLSKDKTYFQQRAAAVSDELSAVQEEVQQTLDERRGLEKALIALRAKLSTSEEEKIEMSQLISEQEEILVGMDQRLDELLAEKEALGETLYVFQAGDSTLITGNELQELDKKVEALYQWIESQEDPTSGLIMDYMSIEGPDSDPVAMLFVSEQANAVQAFILSSEFGRISRMLSSIRAELKRKDGLFFNGYNMTNGEPLLDKPDSGSNVNLGIAILQYTYHSGDSAYLDIVEDIAQELIVWQEESPKGAVPSLSTNDTFSLFENLMAYTFFNMLYAVTENPEYQVARDKISNYIFTILPEEITEESGEMAFITVGPKVLDASGIDPFNTLEKIEKKYSMEETFILSDGEEYLAQGMGQEYLIQGVPGAPEQEQSISFFKTAQMALIYGIMSDYCLDEQMKEKADIYRDKRIAYLKMLMQMVILNTDSSGKQQGFLPDFYSNVIYSGAEVDYSLAESMASMPASVYMIFAYYSYNPFMLKVDVVQELAD